MIREPVVSGVFYPSDKKKLLRDLDNFIDLSKSQENAKMIISPHAGYVYSGHVAGAVFSRIKVPDSVIILGPNHTGLGRRFAIMSEGEWLTPLGGVKINEELAKVIKNKSKLFEEDYLAHVQEHSIEVQLPFMLYKNPDIKIVPICVMHGHYNMLKELGILIAESIMEFKEDVLIVVSSDMSHYLPQEEAVKRDNMAIDRILNLDALGLLETCTNFNITMCGVYPSVIGIEAAKTLGAKESILVKYATSGDINRDYRKVVGYCGIIVK